MIERPLLELRSVSKFYPMAGGPVVAVDEVSFDVRPGRFSASSAKAARARRPYRASPPD